MRIRSIAKKMEHFAKQLLGLCNLLGGTTGDSG